MSLPPHAGNPWLERRAFRWAHQGGAREGPANTIYAMRQALANGAQGIELDVHLTKDRRVVVTHDAHLGRTTNCEGYIAERTLEDLRDCDAAHNWVPGRVDDPHAAEHEFVLRGEAATNPDLRIPTLEQVLDAFPGVPLTIEIKAEAAVDPVVEVLRGRQVPYDQLIVTSFLQPAVDRLRTCDRQLPLGPGLSWTLRFTLRALLGMPPPTCPYVAIQLPYHYGVDDLPARWRRIGRLLPRRLRRLTVIRPRVIRAAHRCEMVVHAWTIDDPQDMRDLLSMGVDGIMTDRPSVLTRVAQTMDGAATAGADDRP